MTIFETKRKMLKRMGAIVRKRRKARGLSEEELAWRVQISDRQLRNIEKGIANPKAETLIPLFYELGITIEEIYEPFAEEVYAYV